jgi:hypothetical protein
MPDSNSESGYSANIRQRVSELLSRNPLLTAKSLCKLLDLSYRDYGAYVNNCKSSWKSNHRNERGSKCSIHAWRGWCYVPEGLDRIRAVNEGWLMTRARNRWLLWRDKIGRLQWFETGRVDLYVRKPANLGKAYQLVCNGFSYSGLITDVKVLESVLAGVRFKGAHYVFPTEDRLPRLVIDLFRRSNGIIIKVGDESHPSSVEVDVCYPDWAERNERMFEEIRGLLRGRFHERSNLKKPEYVT